MEDLAETPLMCLSISMRELGVLCQDSQGTWEQAREEFLQCASTYFPSLRYLAVATPNQTSHIPPIVAYPGDDVHVWKWWSVHRDRIGALVQIRGIRVWKGRRMRERDADAGAII